MTGKLILCATPIGNLGDMTPRCVQTLREADLIAAEDTRNSRKLLTHFDIHTPMTSYHEFNKYDKARELVDKMQQGAVVALITDAGTPGISDPGEVLTQMAVEAGIPVSTNPGAAAFLQALILSGFSTRRFVFEAFLPQEKKEQREVLDSLKEETRTMILYEAPHRLRKTLAELTEVFGEDRPAAICKEAMLRYLSYIWQQRRPDGLVSIGLGDWLQPGKGAGDHTVPNELTSSIMCMYIAWKSARLFDALGLEPHRDFADHMAKAFREAIRRSQIDYVTMTARARCQTAQAMCIYYNVFDEAEKPAACRSLVEMIHEKDDHFDTGMLGVRVIFHVLSDCGEGALAYRMVTREDWPSYGSMLRQGLTAMPEDFLPEEDWDDPASLNHHFMGDFSNWFLQRVAGIRVNPRLTGPDEIDVTPDFIPQLTFAKGHYDAVAGRISVHWYREDDAVMLEINCPAALRGYIELPAGYVFDKSDDTYCNLHGAKRIPLKAGTWKAVKVRKGFAL